MIELLKHSWYCWASGECLDSKVAKLWLHRCTKLFVNYIYLILFKKIVYSSKANICWNFVSASMESVLALFRPNLSHPFTIVSHKVVVCFYCNINYNSIFQDQIDIWSITFISVVICNIKYVHSLKNREEIWLKFCISKERKFKIHL